MMKSEVIMVMMIAGMLSLSCPAHGSEESIGSDRNTSSLEDLGGGQYTEPDGAFLRSDDLGGGQYGSEDGSLTQLEGDEDSEAYTMDGSPVLTGDEND